MLELSCSNFWMPVNHGSVHRTLIQKQWIVRNYRYYSMLFIGIAYPIIWQVIDSAVSIVLPGLTSLIDCCCCFAMLASFSICWLSFVL